MKISTSYKSIKQNPDLESPSLAISLLRNFLADTSLYTKSMNGSGYFDLILDMHSKKHWANIIWEHQSLRLG